jgi:hypothetical protein
MPVVHPEYEDSQCAKMAGDKKIVPLTTAGFATAQFLKIIAGASNLLPVHDLSLDTDFSSDHFDSAPKCD